MANKEYPQGLWKVEQSNEGYHVTETTANGTILFKAYTRIKNTARLICEAVNDAERLRAQNERLLEALKEALPIVKHFIKNHNFVVIEKMEAAIADAEKNIAEKHLEVSE